MTAIGSGRNAVSDKSVADPTKHPRSARAGLLGALVLALLATACASTGHPTPTVKPTARPSSQSPTPEPLDRLAGVTVTPADVAGASRGGNALTIDLLHQFELSRPNANFVDSAYSLATALAMLELGAKGDTEAQIAAVMHSAGVTPEQQAAAWKQFDAALQATARADGISLDVANAIWLQQGKPFDPSFLNTLATNFAAPSSVVDFMGHPQDAAAKVNKWVSDATHGMIPSVVTPDQLPLIEILLADAIYFDAHWANQFDPNGTTQLPFFRPDGSQVLAEMMSSGGAHWTVPAYIGNGVTAVELPYVGGHFAADVIMPNSQPIRSFVASLTPEVLTGIEQQLTPTYMDLTMPKFDLTSSESLIPLLQPLGMTNAFTPDADLSGIDGIRDLHVGIVLQRAKIHVDEVGTTAAAATVVGGLGGAGGPEPPVTFIAIDHPFLFVIRDTTSDAILFTAQVADPTAS
jgi:serpin B